MRQSGYPYLSSVLTDRKPGGLFFTPGKVEDAF
jgi:hypothetical protein